TPTKWTRLLTSRPASTSSGSLLVSQKPITSSHTITQPVLEAPPPLEEPDWSLLGSAPGAAYETQSKLETRNTELTKALHLARLHIQSRDHILEGVHAQMVVQNLHLDKINAALKGKENKAAKKTDLFPQGLGCHMTDSSFVQALEEDNAMRDNAAVAKGQRESDCLQRKAEKEAIELELKATAVEEWKAEVKTLTAAGTRKKEFLKKPKRP
ncbi:hypothetical protein K439DRAFT_1280100, partial [Ramaria rubella]